MKRLAIRAIALLFALVLLYFAFDEASGRFKDWYSDNFIPRPTADVATDEPDQICLTWNGDPATTQAVQWRTAPSVPEGWVQWHGAEKPESEVQELKADATLISDKMVENDRENQRFTATLTGLHPGTNYRYRVGSKNPEHWSAWQTFSTAPAQAAPFSFVYMGDVQRGFDYWGKLLDQAEQKFPAAAFYIVAGDLVDNGDYRDQWDDFFRAGDIFSTRPVIPTLGNHDYDRKPAPEKYLQLFSLPENGPKTLEPERAFSLHYSNADFIVLDSNRALDVQTPWLEEQLRESKATWKFVLYHHPAYVSKKSRENEFIRDTWGPLFERYGVDIALQGHDHAYLRTWPMKGGQPQKNGGDGVTYVVAVAGNKYYEQEAWDYTAKGYVNTSTYQVIDIGMNPDKLTYRAYDMDGNVKDELVLEK